MRKLDIIVITTYNSIYIRTAHFLENLELNKAIKYLNNITSIHKGCCETLGSKSKKKKIQR